MSRLATKINKMSFHTQIYFKNTLVFAKYKKLKIVTFVL